MIPNINVDSKNRERQSPNIETYSVLCLASHRQILSRIFPECSSTKVDVQIYEKTSQLLEQKNSAAILIELDHEKGDRAGLSTLDQLSTVKSRKIILARDGNISRKEIDRLEKLGAEIFWSKQALVKHKINLFKAQYQIQTNKEVAELIGIDPSTLYAHLRQDGTRNILSRTLIALEDLGVSAAEQARCFDLQFLGLDTTERRQLFSSVHDLIKYEIEKNGRYPGDNEIINTVYECQTGEAYYARPQIQRMVLEVRAHLNITLPEEELTREIRSLHREITRLYDPELERVMRDQQVGGLFEELELISAQLNSDLHITQYALTVSRDQWGNPTHTTDIIDAIVCEPYDTGFLAKALCETGVSEGALRKLDDGRIECTYEQFDGKWYRVQRYYPDGDKNGVVARITPHGTPDDIGIAITPHVAFASRYQDIQTGKLLIPYHFSEEALCEKWRIKKDLLHLGHRELITERERWDRGLYAIGLEYKKGGSKSEQTITAICDQLERQRDAIQRIKDTGNSSIPNGIAYVRVVSLHANQRLQEKVTSLNENQSFFEFFCTRNRMSETLSHRLRQGHFALHEVQAIRRVLTWLNDELSSSPTLDSPTRLFHKNRERLVACIGVDPKHEFNSKTPNKVIKVDAIDDKRKSQVKAISIIHEILKQKFAISLNTNSPIDTLHNYTTKWLGGEFVRHYRAAFSGAQGMTETLNEGNLKDLNVPLAESENKQHQQAKKFLTAMERLLLTSEFEETKLVELYFNHFPARESQAKEIDRVSVYTELDGNLSRIPRLFRKGSHVQAIAERLLPIINYYPEAKDLISDVTDINSLQKLAELLRQKKTERIERRSLRTKVEEDFHLDLARTRFSNPKRNETFSPLLTYSCYIATEAGSFTRARQLLNNSQVNSELLAHEEMLLNFCLALPEDARIAVFGIDSHLVTDILNRAASKTSSLGGPTLVNIREIARNTIHEVFVEILPHIKNNNLSPKDFTENLNVWAERLYDARKKTQKYFQESVALMTSADSVGTIGWGRKRVDTTPFRRFSERVKVISEKAGILLEEEDREIEEVLKETRIQLIANPQKVPNDTETHEMAPISLLAQKEAVEFVQELAFASPVRKSILAAFVVTRMEGVEDNALFHGVITLTQTAQTLARTSQTLAQKYFVSSMRNFINYPESWREHWLVGFMQVQNALESHLNKGPKQLAALTEYLMKSSELKGISLDHIKADFFETAAILCLQQDPLYETYEEGNPSLTDYLTAIFSSSFEEARNIEINTKRTLATFSEERCILTQNNIHLRHLYNIQQTDNLRRNWEYVIGESLDNIYTANMQKAEEMFLKIKDDAEQALKNIENYMSHGPQYSKALKQLMKRVLTESQRISETNPLQIELKRIFTTPIYRASRHYNEITNAFLKHGKVLRDLVIIYNCRTEDFFRLCDYRV
jgi:hypothetical protein